MPHRQNAVLKQALHRPVFQANQLDTGRSAALGAMVAAGPPRYSVFLAKPPKER